MNSEEKDETFQKLVSFLPLVIIFIGLTGNTFSFFIFRLSSGFNKIPTMVYLSFIVVFDTFSLFEWNLNHFLDPNFKIKLENLNIYTCKIVTFIQYYSWQSSAMLLSVMCIDRFVTIISIPGSFASRLPFSTLKSAYIWCFLISLIMFLFNIHLLIFNGNYVPMESINSTQLNKSNETKIEFYQVLKKGGSCFWYSPHFRVYPFLEKLNMFIYSFIPFTIMLIFNILLITKTLLIGKINKTKMTQKEIKMITKKRRLTISILSITFAFILMTLPSTICFGYFLSEINSFKNGKQILILIDIIAFLFNSSMFFNCFITNVKFRNYVLNYFKSKLN